MTKQDQINFIRQKCVEVNAEIVALELGCEVSGNIGMVEYLNDPFIVIGLTSVCKKHKKYHETCSAEENGCAVSDAIVVRWGNEEGWGTHTVKESESGKVLGRPIRLADVLLAIRNTNEPSKYYSGITCLGNFTEDFGEKTVWRNEEKKSISWNFRADDLREQSDETVEFLYELLR